MEVLQELLRKLKSIPTVEFMQEIVQENKDYIEDKNTEQLDAGFSSDGSNIFPGYTPFTKAIKAAKGQPYDRVTLKDEGDFYTGINVQAEANGFILKGRDWKTPKLKLKYGELILGLTESSKEDFKEEIVRPEMEYKTRNYILRK